MTRLHIPSRTLATSLVFLFCTSVIFFPSNDLTGLEEIESNLSSAYTNHYAWEWLDVGGSVDDDSQIEMSVLPDGDDQTHLVVAEMEQQGKMRESNLMDSDIPSKEMTGNQGDDGYEWLEHNGRQYYRQVNESASDWEEWNASP